MVAGKSKYPRYSPPPTNALKQRQMKTSVLKASESAAHDLWKFLSSENVRKGKEMFKRKELKEENGFEVSAPYKENDQWVKNEEGKLKRSVCFKFTNNPAPMIEWDETRIDVNL